LSLCGNFSIARHISWNSSILPAIPGTDEHLEIHSHILVLIVTMVVMVPDLPILPGTLEGIEVVYILVAAASR
jgi:hypothetical protein